MNKTAVLRTKIMNKKKPLGKKSKNQIRKIVAKKPLQVRKSRASPNAVFNKTRTRAIGNANAFGKTKTFNRSAIGKRIIAKNKSKVIGSTCTKRSVKTKTFFPVRTVIKSVRLHPTPPKSRLRKSGPKPIRVNKRTGLPWNYDRTVKRIMHYVNPNHSEAIPKTHDQLLEEILTKAFVSLVHRTGCNCFENHSFTNELVHNVARQMYKSNNLRKFCQGQARENAVLTKFHNAAKNISNQRKHYYV